MFPTVILDLYEVIFLPLYHGKSELNRNHHLGNMFFFSNHLTQIQVIYQSVVHSASCFFL